MINATPVILCGGSGPRLWLLSRAGFIKQFLCFTGKDSLFQQAALRLANLAYVVNQVASPIIVTGEDHRFKAVTLTENQSTYIPLGEMHRLANLGMIPLEIIEVQSGSYLGEDDIVRLEDTYGRMAANFSV